MPTSSGGRPAGPGRRTAAAGGAGLSGCLPRTARSHRPAVRAVSVLPARRRRRPRRAGGAELEAPTPLISGVGRKRFWKRKGVRSMSEAAVREPGARAVSLSPARWRQPPGPAGPGRDGRKVAETEAAFCPGGGGDPRPVGPGADKER